MSPALQVMHFLEHFVSKRNLTLAFVNLLRTKLKVFSIPFHIKSFQMLTLHSLSIKGHILNGHASRGGILAASLKMQCFASVHGRKGYLACFNLNNQLESENLGLNSQNISPSSTRLDDIWSLQCFAASTPGCSRSSTTTS